MALLQLHGLMRKTASILPNAPPHTTIDLDDFTAIASSFPDTISFDAMSPEEISEWALGHHRILTAFSLHTTILPLALGAVFTNKAAIEQTISTNHSVYDAALNVLSQLQEYTLELKQVSARPDPPAPADTGRGFLRTRRDSRDLRQTLAAERHKLARRVLNTLDAVAIQIEPAGAPKSEKCLDCVALIPRAQIQRLTQIAKDFHKPAQALDLDIVISGPWPAYSFKIDAHLQRDIST
jgi:hypothetical protein